MEGCLPSDPLLWLCLWWVPCRSKSCVVGMAATRLQQQESSSSRQRSFLRKLPLPDMLLGRNWSSSRGRNSSAAGWSALWSRQQQQQQQLPLQCVCSSKVAGLLLLQS